MGELTASLPGLDYDLSFDDCQSLLDGQAEQEAVNGTDSQKAAPSQPQERHDSMDSCMIHDPGIAKPRTRKPRSQEQARAAQQRFRIRQKARSENLHTQLKDTQSELQQVKQREQQLITRNCLLSKVAQINEVQKSVQCLLWEGKKAILDFPCAHTEQTEEGFALTLTVFGVAESKTAVGVSDMPLDQMATLWKEYISKLSSCLLSLQHDKHGAARQTLNRWVAEARALICCTRAYNPEALKALETNTLDVNDARPAPGKLFYLQQLEMLMLTPGQVSDLLCLYRLQYTMLAGVAQQRKEVLSQYACDLAGVSGRRPHPSDGLALAEKLQTLGLEEYKFHGQVYDAVFYGVLSSIQSALQLVHAYPYLVEPTPLLETLAEQCGQSPNPFPNPLSHQEATALEAQHDALRQYVTSVTSKDCFEYVPMTALQKLCPTKVLQERQQVLLDSHTSHNAAAQQLGTPPKVPLNSHRAHSVANQHPGLQPQMRNSPQYDQTSVITVPTLHELLHDDPSGGGAGPDLRRGFNHISEMPQDHKFVRLLGELAGPPVLPPVEDFYGGGAAQAPLFGDAQEPVIPMSLEMLGRT